MRRLGPLLLLLVTLGGLIAGVWVLFQRRLAHGDVFPPYSSLRTDPLGTRVLHDSLARLPGVRVARSYVPTADWPASPPRTLLLAGLAPRQWPKVTREELDAIEAAVRAGSRLVIAFRATTTRDGAREAEEKARAAEAKRKSRKKPAGKSPREAERKIEPVDLGARWGVQVAESKVRTGPALRTVAAPAYLPPALEWHGELYFAPTDAAWQGLYDRTGATVVVERTLGRGTIVLTSDAYFLSNEALHGDRSTALLAWVVGPHGQVIFDEAHLGMIEQPGIAALARRYGLSGAFFTLLLLAALYVWRRMALFVPPAESADEVALNYHPAAGLEALLRRSVPADQLAGACLKEWQGSARESDRARVSAAWAKAPPRAPAAALYNAAVRALRRH